MHLRLALQTGSKFINNNIEICLNPIMFIEFSQKKYRFWLTHISYLGLMLIFRLSVETIPLSF